MALIMSNEVGKRALIELIRWGINGVIDCEFDGALNSEADWQSIHDMALQQGLSAVVLDGINLVHDSGLMVHGSLPLELKLEWIGEVLQGEQTYKLHQEVATNMANLFHANAIQTYVLKGRIVAECYPKPEHRVSADMDCFLLPLQGEFDAWGLGNDLIRSKHFDVYTDFYKNSTFKLPGLTVENHKYLTPFRGNEKLASLEKVLQSMLRADKGEDIIEESWLYRPPVMVSALFLIEHAYSHFLHEGLTWRMVLDWMLFSEKHKDDINWVEFEVLVDEFGFRKFYDAYLKLGYYLMGKISEEELSKKELRMLKDVWAPLDLHETLHGIKAKFQLAGNYWRARWKYRYFTNMTWMRALYEWVSGAVFDRNPTLE